MPSGNNQRPPDEGEVKTHQAHNDQEEGVAVIRADLNRPQDASAAYRYAAEGVTLCACIQSAF